MSKLFSASGVYVSTSEIEVNGQKFSPLHYGFALVSKMSSGFNEIAIAVVLGIGGIYVMGSLGWTVFGFILLAMGVWLGYNGYQSISGKVQTIVTMTFQTSRTGANTTAQVTLDSYDEGEKLKMALEAAKKAAFDALSLEELKAMAE